MWGFRDTWNMFLTLARCGAHTSNPIRIFLQRKVSHKQTGAIFHHLAKLQIHPIFMIHQGIFGVENSNKGNYPMTSLEFTQILVISKKKKKVSGARTTRAPPFIVNCQEIYLSKPEKTMKTLYFFVAKNKQTSVFFSNIWKVVLSERIPL